MKRPEYIPTFSKALLAGTLTGLAATVMNIIYDIVFRSITNYVPDGWFNFFSITFSSVIILTLTGMLFYLFVKNNSFKSYDVTMITITIVAICIAAFFHADKSEAMFYGNHGLVAGFVIISCMLAVTLLPYLYKHPKLFL